MLCFDNQTSPLAGPELSRRGRSTAKDLKGIQAVPSKENAAAGGGKGAQPGAAEKGMGALEEPPSRKRPTRNSTKAAGVQQDKKDESNTGKLDNKKRKHASASPPEVEPVTLAKAETTKASTRNSKKAAEAEEKKKEDAKSIEAQNKKRRQLPTSAAPLPAATEKEPQRQSARLHKLPATGVFL